VYNILTSCLRSRVEIWHVIAFHPTFLLQIPFDTRVSSVMIQSFRSSHHFFWALLFSSEAQSTWTVICNPACLLCWIQPQNGSTFHVSAWSYFPVSPPRTSPYPQLPLFWCSARHNAHSKGDFRNIFLLLSNPLVHSESSSKEEQKEKN
jgi:hypothetical protein